MKGLNCTPQFLLEIVSNLYLVKFVTGYDATGFGSPFKVAMPEFEKISVDLCWRFDMVS